MFAVVTPDIVVSLVSSLGVGGILAWYLYYNTSVTIPTLTKEHTNSIQNITNSFTASLKEERQSRREEIEKLEGSISPERLCRFRDPGR